jgi:hypothetical protein
MGNALWGGLSQGVPKKGHTKTALFCYIKQERAHLTQAICYLVLDLVPPRSY